MRHLHVPVPVVAQLVRQLELIRAFALSVQALNVRRFQMRNRFQLVQLLLNSLVGVRVEGSQEEQRVAQQCDENEHSDEVGPNVGRFVVNHEQTSEHILEFVEANTVASENVLVIREELVHLVSVPNVRGGFVCVLISGVGLESGVRPEPLYFLGLVWFLILGTSLH